MCVCVLEQLYEWCIYECLSCMNRLLASQRPGPLYPCYLFSLRLSRVNRSESPWQQNCRTEANRMFSYLLQRDKNLVLEANRCLKVQYLYSVFKCFSYLHFLFFCFFAKRLMAPILYEFFTVSCFSHQIQIYVFLFLTSSLDHFSGSY